ncbi:MAG: arylsulfatase [Verrucomicrobia bacterium]|nr:arylsulfatase [Verrucomicrobiota bacterium]
MTLRPTLGFALVFGLFSALAAAEPPNVLLILADDLGYGDLGCYGQKEIQTPHLDRLAAEGMRFTQFYAGSSVCAPSRSCLMTGRHNGRGRVRDNVPHGIHLLAGDLITTEVLRGAGYRTGGFGKWSLGDHGEAGAPWLKGFEEFYGYPNQDHAHFYYPHFLWDTNRVVLLPGNRPGLPAARREYSPDLLLTRALQFLERQRADRRPFFLYYPTILPHWSEFPKDTPESHAIPSDAPYTQRPWPQVEKNFAAMVTRLDRDVGRLLAKLEELGLASRTLVLFTSDNGPSAETIHRPDFFRSAGPFRGHKRLLYEGGIRVPFLARWPGVIAPGAVSATVGGNWDLLPTLAELAGAPPPPDLDGLSLAPVLRGRPRPREHEFLYWDYGHTRTAFLQAVRAGDWKAVRPALNQPTELYDLAGDPAESRDLARERPEIVARLEGLMRRSYVPSPDYPIKTAPVERRP